MDNQQTYEIECHGYIVWSYKACPSVEKFDDRNDYFRRLKGLKVCSGSVYKNDWSTKGFSKSELADLVKGPVARAQMFEWF